MSYDSVRNPEKYQHLSFNQSAYAQAMDAMEAQEKECAAAGCEEDHNSKCSLSADNE